MLPEEAVMYIGGALTKLGDHWEMLRDAKKFDEAAVILDHYQGLVRYMLSTGYRDYLPVDSELPDEFMPPEYLEMAKHIVVTIPGRQAEK